eukprot:12922993-Prorocentrum_lima.AAC.1
MRYQRVLLPLRLCSTGPPLLLSSASPAEAQHSEGQETAPLSRPGGTHTDPPGSPESLPRPGTPRSDAMWWRG